MTNKVIIIGILAISLIIFSNEAAAQTREVMPKEVQVKMDSNKLAGLSEWDGINFIFQVSVTGLEPSERQILLDRAKDVKEIISIDFSLSGDVIIVVPGGTDFVIVKPIFQVIVTGISSIQTKGELN